MMHFHMIVYQAIEHSIIDVTKYNEDVSMAMINKNVQYKKQTPCSSH